MKLDQNRRYSSKKSALRQHFDELVFPSLDVNLDEICTTWEMIDQVVYAVKSNSHSLIANRFSSNSKAKACVTLQFEPPLFSLLGNPCGMQTKPLVTDSFPNSFRKTRHRLEYAKSHQARVSAQPLCRRFTHVPAENKPLPRRVFGDGTIQNLVPAILSEPI